MIQNFNYFNQPENPNLILCNPNRIELFPLSGIAKDIKLKLVLNGLHQLSFSFPEKANADDEEVFDAYAYLVSKRLIYFQDVGYFIITQPDENKSNEVSVKNITAISQEFELTTKRLTNFSHNGIKFYDPMVPASTMLGLILSFLPGWSAGSIDGTLIEKYRSFNITDTNIYNFLMNDAEKAYECIFTFNTVAKTINAYARENAIFPTDIYLSFNNLLKSGRMKELSDEITTCLHVYGAGNLDIRSVNPLGTTAIYNFDYFANTNWMSEKLVSEISLWKTTYDYYQPLYATYLTELKVLNDQYVVLEGNTADAKTDLDAAEGVLKVLIESGHTEGEYEDHYLEVLADYNYKNEVYLAALKIQDNAKADLQTKIDGLSFYNDAVGFENNFTSDSLLELNNYIYQNTYQNENFIQTDEMTESEIRDMSQQLYDQGKTVLTRLSQPSYEFELESTNFLFLKEFEPFIQDLNLGAIATIDFGNNYTIQSYLLEINIDYENPTDFSLVFSNKLRKNNGSFIFSDLFSQAVNVGSKAGFKDSLWSDWSNNYKDRVSEYISSALDAAKNAVINSTDQEIVLNANGLRGRKLVDADNMTYDQKEVWLTNTVLAFTRDNWQTASAALGNIQLNGEDFYGLVADSVVGRLLAGNELVIENINQDGETVNFSLNAQGCFLNNASFQLTTDENITKILLDPNIGIKVQSNVDKDGNIVGWTDKFYVDSVGNIIFSGTLKGADGEFAGKIIATEGSIGGFTIKDTGIYSPGDTHFLQSNGTLQWGKLYIDGDEAHFEGDIYANHLHGTIDQTQDISIPGDVVDYGFMSGNRVYGGTMTGNGGVKFDLSSSGNAIVEGGSAIYLKAGGGVAGIMVNGVNNTIELNASETRVTRNLRISGKILPDPFSSTSGLTTTIVIGSAILTFQNGILTGSVGGEL